MRLGELVEEAKAGSAAFERQVGEFEASKKEAAEQQALIDVLQDVERGHEQVVDKLRASHQTILQEVEEKGPEEQTKPRHPTYKRPNNSKGNIALLSLNSRLSYRPPIPRTDATLEPSPSDSGGPSSKRIPATYRGWSPSATWPSCGLSKGLRTSVHP